MAEMSPIQVAQPNPFKYSIKLRLSIWKFNHIFHATTAKNKHVAEQLVTRHAGTLVRNRLRMRS